MKKFFLKNRRLCVLIIALVFVIGLSLFMPRSDGFSLQLKEIEYAPYGVKKALSKESLMQKPYMLIEFFSLQCPYCVKNIPTLNGLHVNKKMSVVGYVMESESRVEAYAQKHNILFPIAKTSEHYMELFEPNVVPMSFVIDTKTLEVKEKIIGVIDPKKLEIYLK
jgi:hypothetical protein